MKKVLLTGAAGFVGSRVAAVLLEHGHEVFAIVRDAEKCPKGCIPIVADLVDPNLKDVIGERCEDADVLIHLAATLPVAMPGPEQRAQHEAQISMAERLLDACPNVRHVIFSSTLDVYGVPPSLPVTEQTPLNPITDYAKAKVQIEKLLAERCASSGKKLTILRLTQVYGPGEPVIKAIPKFIAAIARGETPVLFGEGEELRDFVYVDDAATAFLSAVEKGQSGIFNIATGQSVTIRHALDEIIAASGKAIAPEFRPRAKPRIDFTFDITAARTALGFKSETSLKKGLKAHYDWYTQHLA